MKARNLLSSSLGRSDDEPNKKLASLIIAEGKSDWITELVEILFEKKGDVKSDAIKVLYEIGQNGRPDLIAPNWNSFIEVIGGKTNRLVWGAMIALDTIALIKPNELFRNIDVISQAILKGSTITIDHGVSILAKLASKTDLQERVMPLLVEQLLSCPPKQFPMYLERSEVAFCRSTKFDLLNIAELRLKDLEKESQRRRVLKMIKKLNSIT